jgi:hypothetical protein
MGDVISISRVSDVDIFSEFDAQCPDIPENIDSRIPRSARKAVDKGVLDRDHNLFRKHCAIVVALSVCGLLIVKVVSGAIAAQSGMRSVDFEHSATDHRLSQSSWAAYIRKLENDAFYRHVQQEKHLYSLQYAE